MNKILTDLVAPVQHINIARHLIVPNGNFPNNPAIPMLVYPECIRGSAEDLDDSIRNIRQTPAPLSDPLYGTDGPLLKNWRS